MGFNGIGGYTNEPGMIPWELVVLYFAVALGIVFVIGKRSGGLKRFTTIDLVYIAIGGAIAVVWEFYIGNYIGRAIPSTPFVDVSFWGRVFILFIVAALVRKPGVGMSVMFVFNLLSDQFSYGYGGEPMFFVYEMLTYGLIIDIMISLTGGNLFGVKGPWKGPNWISSPTATVVTQETKEQVTKAMLSPTALAVIEGAILGFFMAFPDPLFYSGFFNPFLYAATVNWGKILFSIAAFIPGDIIVGILAGLAALRVSKAV